MIRYFEIEDLEPTAKTKPVDVKAIIPLLEDEDYTVAWKKGYKVTYLGKNEEKNLHIVQSRHNKHKYYFTDEEMKKWFEEVGEA
jgi:hypothetical protein